jgi:hypothetical protein
LVELELWLTTSQPIDVSCFVLTYDGANRISGSVTSEIVTVSPKDLLKPERPTHGNVTIAEDKMMLQISHNNVCFVEHSFFPEVFVNGDTINGHDFKFNEMIEVPFDGLRRGAAYEVNVIAVCQNDESIRSEPWTRTVHVPTAGICFQT